jgi:hypothetical protein
MKVFNSLLLIVIITSCQFTPDDIYYVERSKPQPPEVEVIELSLDTDTIFLTYYQDIRFHFSAGNHNILQVGILIDGEEKYVRSNYQDNFTILASDLSEGIHKLSFSVITNTNSGSIADLLGYEGYQFISHEWTLICVKNDKRAGFIRQQTDNGKLKLSWEEHDKINFKGYRITKRYDKYYGIVKEFRTSEPWLIDEGYVGEKAYYDVYTEYYSSAGYEFHWAEIEIENLLPAIQIRRNQESNYEVYWENNEFAQSIESYRLIDLVSPADTVVLWEGKPSEDNHFVMPDAVFGNEIHYRLVSIPGKPDKPFNNDDVYFHSTAYRGLIGDKSISYRHIASSGENELLIVKDNFIYRYAVLDEKLVDSLTYNWTHCGIAYGGFSLSPGRKYFTTHESCNNNLVLMQPGNLSNYKSYPTNHIITQGMRFNSLPVSDNGIVIAKDYGGVYIYDVLQDKLIGSLITNESIGTTNISSLGNYFAIQTSILRFYKIINQEIVTVWESDQPYNYVFTSFDYDPENPDNIILHDGNQLYHKNASDFTTVKTFPLAEENILNVDFISRRLLAYSSGFLSVYSIDNGEQLFKTKVDPRVNMTQHSCRLALNTIYLKDGICLHLPD